MRRVDGSRGRGVDEKGGRPRTTRGHRSSSGAPARDPARSFVVPAPCFSARLGGTAAGRRPAPGVRRFIRARLDGGGGGADAPVDPALLPPRILDVEDREARALGSPPSRAGEGAQPTADLAFVRVSPPSSPGNGTAREGGSPSDRSVYRPSSGEELVPGAPRGQPHPARSLASRPVPPAPTLAIWPEPTDEELAALVVAVMALVDDPSRRQSETSSGLVVSPAWAAVGRRLAVGGRNGGPALGWGNPGQGWGRRRS